MIVRNRGLATLAGVIALLVACDAPPEAEPSGSVLETSATATPTPTRPVPPRSTRLAPGESVTLQSERADDIDFVEVPPPTMLGPSSEVRTYLLEVDSGRLVLLEGVYGLEFTAGMLGGEPVAIAGAGISDGQRDYSSGIVVRPDSETAERLNVRVSAGRPAPGSLGRMAVEVHVHPAVIDGVALPAGAYHLDLVSLELRFVREEPPYRQRGEWSADGVTLVRDGDWLRTSSGDALVSVERLEASPDERWLAIQSADGAYLVSVAEQAVYEIDVGTFDLVTFAWTQEGDRVAVTRGIVRDDSLDPFHVDYGYHWSTAIVEVDSLVDGEARLFDPLPQPWWAQAWTVDGDGLLVSERYGRVTDAVWFLSVDGSSERLPFKPAIVWSIATAADGSRLAWSTSEQTLVIFDLTDGIEVITPPALDGFIGVADLSLSPDGRWLAFTASAGRS